MGRTKWIFERDREDLVVNTQLASNIDDTETYVDTGSYIFNGLVSGSIFGGVSGNKITAIAGESSYWKNFLLACSC